MNQISGGITIVKVGGSQSPTNTNINRTTQTDNNGRHSRFIIFINFILFKSIHIIKIINNFLIEL